jgi:hypothetical protein
MQLPCLHASHCPLGVSSAADGQHGSVTWRARSHLSICFAQAHAHLSCADSVALCAQTTTWRHSTSNHLPKSRSLDRSVDARDLLNDRAQRALTTRTHALHPCPRRSISSARCAARRMSSDTHPRRSIHAPGATMVSGLTVTIAATVLLSVRGGAACVFDCTTNSTCGDDVQKMLHTFYVRCTAHRRCSCGCERKKNICLVHRILTARHAIWVLNDICVWVRDALQCCAMSSDHRADGVPLSGQRLLSGLEPWRCARRVSVSRDTVLSARVH